MNSTTQSVTAEEWNTVRESFRRSMMVQTEIHKLAQNLDLSWPTRGRDEVPLKYLPFTLEEVLMMPGIAESPERLRLLIEILNETMAFDDPFGEMAEHVDSSSKKDDSSQRALEKLGVPLDFPLSLCALSGPTRDFCATEEIKTVGEFIEFGSNMAQNIVVGGDFRAFLNAVAQPEEAAIAQFLPYRPGKNGLHYPESIGQVLTLFDRSETVYLYDQAGATIKADDRRDTQPLSDTQKSDVGEKLRNHMQTVFNWFPGCRSELEDALAEGQHRAERLFIPLDNPAVEKTALWATSFVLGLDKPAQPVKRGFFARFLGR